MMLGNIAERDPLGVPDIEWMKKSDPGSETGWMVEPTVL